MTKKRFVETISTGIVTDNVTGKEYRCEMRIDEDLLELLNELHEKNRELQRHLDVMISGALTDDKRIKELYDENEQLKQRNDRQAKQLDRLYRLIEEKDWRALTDIVDDFKRCEEQLQREWRAYE